MSLAGRRLHRIDYFGFMEDSRAVADWDFGDRHQPIMGVEIALAPGGATHSFVWGHAFGNFHLDVVRAPMRTQLAAVGEPDGPRVWDVSDHPRWASLIAEPIVQARLVWLSNVTDRVGRAPIAICLWFPGGRVWIAAAAERNGRRGEPLEAGANELVVIFSRDRAHSFGLLADDA